MPRRDCVAGWPGSSGSVSRVGSRAPPTRVAPANGTPPVPGHRPTSGAGRSTGCAARGGSGERRRCRRGRADSPRIDRRRGPRARSSFRIQLGGLALVGLVRHHGWSPVQARPRPYRSWRTPASVTTSQRRGPHCASMTQLARPRRCPAITLDAGRSATVHGRAALRHRGARDLAGLPRRGPRPRRAGRAPSDYFAITSSAPARQRHPVLRHDRRLDDRRLPAIRAGRHDPGDVARGRHVSSGSTQKSTRCPETRTDRCGRIRVALA